MPQVDRKVAKDRAAQLRALGDSQFSKLCESRLGMIENVLVERDGLGRTEQFVPLAVPGFSQGQIVPVRVTGVSPTGLVGEPIRTAA
jgi:threonylcarbamoyladenosine tRNA methylthiotransferase MtaB